MRNFKEAEAKCRESLAVCEMLDEVHAQAIPGNYMTLGDIAVEQGDLGRARASTTASRSTSPRRWARSTRRWARTAGSRRSRSGEKRYDEARAPRGEGVRSRPADRFQVRERADRGDPRRPRDRAGPPDGRALEHYEKAAGQYTSLSKYRFALKALSKIGLIHAAVGEHLRGEALSRPRAGLRPGRYRPRAPRRVQRACRDSSGRRRRRRSSNVPRHAEDHDRVLRAERAHRLREGRAGVLRAGSRTPSRRSSRRTRCTIALKTESDSFVTVDPSGHPPAAPADAGLSLLFTKTLSLGVASRQPFSRRRRRRGRYRDPRRRRVRLDPAQGDGRRHRMSRASSSTATTSRFRSRTSISSSWFGRQIAANVMLMLHLNEGFLKEEDAARARARKSPAPRGESKQRFENLIGKSESMRKIFRTLEKIKDTDSGILILGESGTGKSALARAIHYRSPRRNRPFREIHCAQIPHGLLESELFGHERGAFTGATHRKMGLCETADGGTLFLDDINVVPNEIQAKLLRFIENKTFVRLGGTQDLTADVRIVAASNEDLESALPRGAFPRGSLLPAQGDPHRSAAASRTARGHDRHRARLPQEELRRKGDPAQDALARRRFSSCRRRRGAETSASSRTCSSASSFCREDTIITPESLPEDFLREAAGTSKQSQRHLDELVEEIIKLGGYSEANPLLPMLEALIVTKMVSSRGAERDTPPSFSGSRSPRSTRGSRTTKDSSERDCPNGETLHHTIQARRLPRRLLERSRSIPDRSLNGLQVEGRARIERAAFAVDASLDTIRAAARAKAEILVVHHGLFWSRNERITGVMRKRIGALVESELSLYAAHLPLDCHEEVGNNVEIARLLGLEIEREVRRLPRRPHRVHGEGEGGPSRAQRSRAIGREGAPVPRRAPGFRTGDGTARRDRFGRGRGVRGGGEGRSGATPSSRARRRIRRITRRRRPGST